MITQYHNDGAIARFTVFLLYNAAVFGLFVSGALIFFGGTCRLCSGVPMRNPAEKVSAGILTITERESEEFLRRSAEKENRVYFNRKKNVWEV